MDHTNEMFRLICSENHVVGESLGLSAGIAKGLAGWVTSIVMENGNTLDLYVAEVINQAENFGECVQSRIADVKCNYLVDGSDSDDGDSNVLRAKEDLRILEEMLTWAFDSAELKILAEEDWKELHDEQVEA